MIIMHACIVSWQFFLDLFYEHTTQEVHTHGKNYPQNWSFLLHTLLPKICTWLHELSTN